MLRVELKWWVWLILALIVYMVWRSPGEMGYVFGGLLHGFTGVGDAVLRGIGAVRASG